MLFPHERTNAQPPSTLFGLGDTEDMTTMTTLTLPTTSCRRCLLQHNKHNYIVILVLVSAELTHMRVAVAGSTTSVKLEI